MRPRSLIIGCDVSLSALGTSFLQASASGPGGAAVGPRFRRGGGGAGDEEFGRWVEDLREAARGHDDVAWSPEFVRIMESYAGDGGGGGGGGRRKKKPKKRRGGASMSNRDPPSSSSAVLTAASSSPPPPLLFVLGWPRPLTPSGSNEKEMLCVASFALGLGEMHPGARVACVDERYSSAQAGGWGNDSGAARVILERALAGGGGGDVEPEEVWEWCLRARRPKQK